MISFANINKQYGKQLLFVDASFQLNPGEKVGLVGPNGAGKTTLFRMVVGEETPDEGAVSVPKKLTIGYFRQDVEEMQGRSVLDEAIAGSGRVGDLHHELEALQREMSDPDKADDMDRILDRFGHVQEEYEHLGGYALESQAREVLHGLGFKDDQIDGDVGALSGGWKMRVALVGIPVKVNIDSGGKPNGIPERRRTAVGAKRRWHGDCGVSVRNRQARLSGAKRRQVRRGFGVQGKGAAAPLPLLPRCRRRNSFLDLVLWWVAFFAHRFSTHLNAMSVMHQAVEDAIGDSGIADLFVPA